MKQTKEKILEILNKISGKLLFIGDADLDMTNILSGNFKITYCDILGSVDGIHEGKKSKSKYLNMKDIKKYYKKKTIDYLICNLKDIKKHLPRFIQTSIYICKGTIYIYGSNEIYDLESLCHKFRRYKCDIKVMEYKDAYIVKIDVNNIKNKIFMDKVYYIVDKLGMIADKISDTIIG